MSYLLIVKSKKDVKEVMERLVAGDGMIDLMVKFNRFSEKEYDGLIGEVTKVRINLELEKREIAIDSSSQLRDYVGYFARMIAGYSEGFIFDPQLMKNRDLADFWSVLPDDLPITIVSEEDKLKEKYFVWFIKILKGARLHLLDTNNEKVPTLSEVVGFVNVPVIKSEKTRLEMVIEIFKDKYHQEVNLKDYFIFMIPAEVPMLGNVIYLVVKREFK